MPVLPFIATDLSQWVGHNLLAITLSLLPLWETTYKTLPALSSLHALPAPQYFDTLHSTKLTNTYCKSFYHMFHIQPCAFYNVPHNQVMNFLPIYQLAFRVQFELFHQLNEPLCWVALLQQLVLVTNLLSVSLGIDGCCGVFLWRHLV
jgi:hypothetical protein